MEKGCKVCSYHEKRHMKERHAALIMLGIMAALIIGILAGILIQIEIVKHDQAVQVVFDTLKACAVK